MSIEGDDVSYLRVTKTVLIRKMPLGTYLYVPSSLHLESFSPVMEIDQAAEQLLKFCNGSKTRSDILQSLSEESGEPVEEIAGDFDEFVNYLVDEGVVEWVENPEPIDPIYRGNRPFRMLLDVTSACSLHCPFCSVDPENFKDELTFADITSFVDQVKMIKPTLFTLSGGEPLLKKDMVLYIAKEVSSIEEVGFYIFTNGCEITREYARELYDAGLRFARVSVDGHTEELHDHIKGIKGAFRKTIQGIKYLREAGIHVTVVSLIFRMNYPYYKEIREFVSHLADNYVLSFDYPCGKAAGSHLLLSPEERVEVRMYDIGSQKIQTAIYPQSRCLMGEILYITSNGDSFPCLYMNFPEFKLGNIREKSLSEMYKNELVHTILELTVNDIEECKECDFRYYCRGGCRGHAFGMCGSLYVRDPLDCQVNKATVQSILENGEETTLKLMKELVESTRNLDEEK